MNNDWIKVNGNNIPTGVDLMFAVSTDNKYINRVIWFGEMEDTNKAVCKSIGYVEQNFDISEITHFRKLCSLPDNHTEII